MLLTADQHRRLAEVFEEAAADQSHTPEDLAGQARTRRVYLGHASDAEAL